MNKEQIKGSTQKMVGETKESLGKATKNDRLMADGLADRAAGTMKKAAGDAKEALRKR
jgi:uncharacterized protein YjbJ (UPF0337 family)